MCLQKMYRKPSKNIGIRDQNSETSIYRVKIKCIKNIKLIKIFKILKYNLR